MRRGAIAAPLHRASLVAAQLGHLEGHVGVLDGLDAAAVAAVLEAVLAERPSAQGPKVELVWTGPEGKSGWARPTVSIVRNLFARAQVSVLVAGYSFDHGAEILEPLHAAMKERGVSVSLYVNIERASKKTANLTAHASRELATFLAKNWPFGPPSPALYYNPRTLRPTSTESLHAKCIVVDERIALVGSANFTELGSETPSPSSTSHTEAPPPSATKSTMQLPPGRIERRIPTPAPTPEPTRGKPAAPHLGPGRCPPAPQAAEPPPHRGHAPHTPAHLRDGICASSTGRVSSSTGRVSSSTGRVSSCPPPAGPGPRRGSRGASTRCVDRW